MSEKREEKGGMRQGQVKVLHLISSRGLYGAERIVVNLTAATDRERFTPSLALLQAAGKPNTELIEAIEEKQAKTHVVPSRRWIDLDAVRQIKQLVREEGIDLIHCHEMKGRLYGLLAARGTKARAMTTHHNWIRSDFLVTCFENFDGFYLRFFPKIVAVSQEVRQLMHRYLISDKKIEVIINGIDMQEFRRDQAARERIRQEFGIAPETPLIGTFGRLSPEKGQKHLITAAEQVLKTCPEARFLLVGDGFQGEEMREYAASLGIAEQVIFAGFRKDVAQLYSALDIFVLPSLLEGTPMALLEAMATALPAISSEVGGVGRIIEDGVNGLLVPPAEPEQLAAAILRLVKDRAEAERLAKQALVTIAERYSAQRMAEAYMQVYEELLEE